MGRIHVRSIGRITAAIVAAWSSHGRRLTAAAWRRRSFGERFLGKETVSPWER
jgi:hypothetical protein